MGEAVVPGVAVPDGVGVSTRVTVSGEGLGETAGVSVAVGDAVPTGTGARVAVARARDWPAAVGVTVGTMDARLGACLAVGVAMGAATVGGVGVDVDNGLGSGASCSPEQPDARAIDTRAATTSAPGTLADNFYDTPGCQRLSLYYGTDDRPGLDPGAL